MLSVTFRRGVLMFGFISGLAISGCAAPNNSADAPTMPASSSSQATTAPDDDPASSVTPPPQTALMPVPTPVPDPASLVGYDGTSLVDLLGPPSFTRQDSPAELWQYRNETCTLDLFLYEGSSGVYSVEHLEFREAIVSKADIEHCLRTIIEQKLTAASAT